jgi:hypothetical protein
MIVKICGELSGLYTESTYEEVSKHMISKCPEGFDMSDGDVYSGGKTPYVRLTLVRSTGESEHVYFNTVGYLMESSSGKTIDVLRYDKLER